MPVMVIAIVQEPEFEEAELTDTATPNIPGPSVPAGRAEPSEKTTAKTKTIATIEAKRTIL
jgi:hypothetical protein